MSSDFASLFGSSGPSGLLRDALNRLRPPDWLVDELQNRVVLALNHVLMQEPHAQERLRRQKGKQVLVQWNDFHMTLAATPAGLLERPGAAAAPDLTMTLTQSSPLAMAQSVVAGNKPAVDIQGDVQLAAEVAWLVDNVRWDMEEDLARLIGDAPAHTLTRMAVAAAQALRTVVSGVVTRVVPSASSASPSATTAPDHAVQTATAHAQAPVSPSPDNGGLS